MTVSLDEFKKIMEKTKTFPKNILKDQDLAHSLIIDSFERMVMIDRINYLLDAVSSKDSDKTNNQKEMNVNGVMLFILIIFTIITTLLGTIMYYLYESSKVQDLTGETINVILLLIKVFQ